MTETRTLERILFRHVLPVPLQDSPISGRVWNHDLILERGKQYLIVADSGKGKSTFLNIIYGIRKDYTGSVLFDQSDICTYKSDGWSQHRSSRISYLFQDLRLFGELTAMENITLKPGCRLTETDIESMATALGVSVLLKRKCATLSLGQQQRIAMIRALSQPFQWLLLDEPFSHLDDNNARLMMEHIQQRCREENAGIIATSLGSTHGFQGFETLEL